MGEACTVDSNISRQVMFQGEQPEIAFSEYSRSGNEITASRVTGTSQPPGRVAHQSNTGSAC